MAKKSRPTSPSPIFFGHKFHPPLPPPPITIAGPSNSLFENFKFSKMLDEDTISRIWGSRLWWGKLDDENHGRKNWKRRFDFFGRDFHHPTTHTLPLSLSQSLQNPQWVTKIAPKKLKALVWLFGRDFHHPTTHTFPHPIAVIAGPSMVNENRAEKIENVSLIFLAVIFSTPPYCNHCKILKFAILNLQTFLGIYSWKYRICESRNYDESGGENHGWKNRKRLQDVEKMFKVWTRQVARLSRQTSSRSPSRFTDLAGQLAVWTHLKKQLQSVPSISNQKYNIFHSNVFQTFY